MSQAVVDKTSAKKTPAKTPQPLCRHCVQVRTRLTRGAYTQRVCGKAGKVHLLIEPCPFFQRAVGADDELGGSMIVGDPAAKEVAHA